MRDLKKKMAHNYKIKCEKCKCLLFSIDAIMGKEEIREKITFDRWPCRKESYINKSQYCLRCAPTKLKERKK